MIESSQAPTLSVIVCTHNRARDARECVEALLASAGVEQLELIVVDNASEAHESALLAQGVAGLPVRLVSEPVPGLSHARNRGLRLARAAWVAYLDDDALPFPDWVLRALALVTRPDPSLAVIGGAVYPRWPEHAVADHVEPAHLGNRWRDLLSLIELEHYPDDSNVPQVVGCNLLVRRSALEEIGGFSAELGRTPERLLGGEEIDMVRKICARGRRVTFDAGLRVHHKIHAERLSPAWVRRRAEAEGELLWKCAGSPRLALKVLLSIPYLALASGLRTLPAGSPRDYDHHVRLWNNLGFVKSAMAAMVRPVRQSELASRVMP